MLSEKPVPCLSALRAGLAVGTQEGGGGGAASAAGGPAGGRAP